MSKKTSAAVTTVREDIYSKVTQKIIASLEQGVRPWMKPWSVEHTAGRITKPLRCCGTPYRGINVLLLWSEAVERGYVAPIWMTYKQSQERGGQVRKGEKGTQIVYADRLTKTEENDKGEEVERSIPFMKTYTVFCVEQIDGLTDIFYAKFTNNLPPERRIAEAEKFIANTGATIIHGGNRAYYAPGPDVIRLPPFEAFKDAESYYGTCLHEQCHWTKAKHRLDRDFGRKHFGDEGYAREELVAEMGAAFLCADLGITPEIRDDHAAYISHWLDVLQSDKRAIFQTAAHAQRAADYLHSLQKSEQAVAERGAA